MNANEALLEMSLLNAEAEESEFEQIYLTGQKMGIAPEIMTRLRSIWTQTKVVRGESVAIGKIIVNRIFEFLKANPRIVVGVAIGMVIGYLIVGIPFLGPLLAPLAKLLPLAGAGYGAASENGAQPSAMQTLTVLVEKFFELLVSVFNGVATYISASK
jgi:hypothetical protein